MRNAPMKLVAGAVVLVGLVVPMGAETPELYRQVASVHWVVKDLDRVKAGWEKLGFPSQDLGEMSIAGSLRGQTGSSRFRLAQAYLAGANVVWIQPIEGESIFSEHLDRHGDGIVSVNYAAPSRETLDAEVARLAGLGVSVLQRGELVTPSGRLQVVHMDTAAEGKYIVGLQYGDASPTPAQMPPPAVPLKLSQYALLVRSLEPVSAFWQRLGFPVMEITHGALSDLRYRGQPGQFDQKLGWHRHGNVTWEWIESLAGPTVFDEHMKAHGEGLHHLGFDVPDMDAACAAWEALGVAVIQSGAWGENGKPGSGRFAYLATDGFGGVTTEFLWNYR